MKNIGFVNWNLKNTLVRLVFAFGNGKSKNAESQHGPFLKFQECCFTNLQKCKFGVGVPFCTETCSSDPSNKRRRKQTENKWTVAAAAAELILKLTANFPTSVCENPPWIWGTIGKGKGQKRKRKRLQDNSKPGKAVRFVKMPSWGSLSGSVQVLKTLSKKKLKEYCDAWFQWLKSRIYDRGLKVTKYVLGTGAIAEVAERVAEFDRALRTPRGWFTNQLWWLWLASIDRLVPVVIYFSNTKIERFFVPMFFENIGSNSLFNISHFPLEVDRVARVFSKNIKHIFRSRYLLLYSLKQKRYSFL